MRRSLRKQEADAWPVEWYERDESGQPKFGMQISEHARWFLPPPKGWRPPSPEAPDNPRDLLPGLWAHGRLVFENMVQLFGRPADLIIKHWLRGREAELCRDWISNLENLVRCILIIAALTMQVVRPKPRPASKARPARPPEEKKNLQEIDPANWPVSLRIFPSEREARRLKRRAPKEKRDYADALLLAKRMEALYRIPKHQDRYARRLTFRLARLKDANIRANAPRMLRVRDWRYRFDFYNRTPGQHAIQASMTPAHYCAGNLLAWHDLAPG